MFVGSMECAEPGVSEHERVAQRRVITATGCLMRMHTHIAPAPAQVENFLALQRLLEGLEAVIELVDEQQQQQL